MFAEPVDQCVRGFHAGGAAVLGPATPLPLIVIVSTMRDPLIAPLPLSESAAPGA